MGSAASIAVAAVVCVVSIVVTGVMGYFLYRKTRLANIQREQLEHYENEIEQLTSHNSTKHLVSVKISESMEEVHATLSQRNNTCEAEESTRTSPFGTESEISGRAPPQGHVAPNNKSNNKTTERRVIKNILKRGCTPRSCCSSNTTEVQSHTISPSKNPVRCNQVLDNEQWTPASDYGLQEDLQFGDLNSERRLGGTSRTLDPVPLCMPLPTHRSTEHTSHNVLEVLNPVRRRLLTLHTSCTYHPISMAPKKLYPTHNASSKGCQTEGYILHIPEEGITLKTVDGLNQAQFCRTQLDGCSTDGGPLDESEFAARYSDPNGGAYAARLTSQRLSYSARNAAAQFTFTPVRNYNPNQSKGTCYNSCSKTVDVEDENLLHLSPPCAMQDVTDENRTPLPSVKKGGFSNVDPGRLNGTSQNESNTALVKRQMKEGMSHRAPTGVDTSIKSGRELNFLSEMDGNRLANAMHSNELVGAPNAIYCSVSPARQSTSQNGCWLMGPVELRVFHSELPSEVPQGSNVHTRTLSFPAASVERMSFTNSVPHV